MEDFEDEFGDYSSSEESEVEEEMGGEGRSEESMKVAMEDIFRPKTSKTSKWMSVKATSEPMVGLKDLHLDDEEEKNTLNAVLSPTKIPTPASLCDLEDGAETEDACGFDLHGSTDTTESEDDFDPENESGGLFTMSDAVEVKSAAKKFAGDGVGAEVMSLDDILDGMGGQIECDLDPKQKRIFISALIAALVPADELAPSTLLSAYSEESVRDEASLSSTPLGSFSADDDVEDDDVVDVSMEDFLCSVFGVSGESIMRKYYTSLIQILRKDGKKFDISKLDRLSMKDLRNETCVVALRELRNRTHKHKDISEAWKTFDQNVSNRFQKKKVSRFFKGVPSKFKRLFSSKRLEKIGPTVGRIVVNVIEARNLLAKDRGDTSDPYAIISITTRPKVTFKTPVIWKSLNPFFDCDPFPIDITKTDLSSPDTKLKVQLFDKDRGNRDDFLGEWTVNLHTLENGCYVDDWFVLQKRSEKSRVQGDVHIAYSYQSFDVVGEEDEDALDDTQKITSLVADLQVICQKMFFHDAEISIVNRFLRSYALWFDISPQELFLEKGFALLELVSKSLRSAPNGFVQRFSETFATIHMRDDIKEKIWGDQHLKKRALSLGNTFTRFFSFALKMFRHLPRETDLCDLLTLLEWLSFKVDLNEKLRDIHSFVQTSISACVQEDIERFQSQQDLSPQHPSCLGFILNGILKEFEKDRKKFGTHCTGQIDFFAILGREYYNSVVPAIHACCLDEENGNDVSLASGFASLMTIVRQFRDTFECYAIGSDETLMIDEWFMPHMRTWVADVSSHMVALVDSILDREDFSVDDTMCSKSVREVFVLCDQTFSQFMNMVETDDIQYWTELKDVMVVSCLKVFKHFDTRLESMYEAKKAFLERSEAAKKIPRFKMHSANQDMCTILNDLRRSQDLVLDFTGKLDAEDKADGFIELSGNMGKFVFHSCNQIAHRLRLLKGRDLVAHALGIGSRKEEGFFGRMFHKKKQSTLSKTSSKELQTPLLNFLDMHLEILSVNLLEDNFEKVLRAVWKHFLVPAMVGTTWRRKTLEDLSHDCLDHMESLLTTLQQYLHPSPDFGVSHSVLQQGCTFVKKYFALYFSSVDSLIEIAKMDLGEETTAALQILYGHSKIRHNSVATKFIHKLDAGTRSRLETEFSGKKEEK
eukprot:TRINITY_DN80_c1_g1_i1.p1 TRINITY_DN80_c1_g1~~TRINITY_DN80_c1_g1_i1.p1  ORF type:complete len:1158 (-),score=339.55 TRINITY_DN80_c1_g1_i1:168-3641(-)